MITEEELEAANIENLLNGLAGAGNTAMMTMVIAAQSSVSFLVRYVAVSIALLLVYYMNIKC